MHELDGPGWALGDADATPLTLRHLDLRRPHNATHAHQFVADARDAVGTHPHTGQAGGAFRSIHLGHGAPHAESILAEDGRRPGGRGLRLHHRLADELRIVRQARQVDAFGGKIHRAQLDVRFQEEPIEVAGDLERRCQLLGSLRRDYRIAEHQQVRCQHDPLAKCWLPRSHL